MAENARSVARCWAVAVAVAVTAATAGCGDDNPASRDSGAESTLGAKAAPGGGDYVSREVQARLPTQRGSLLATLCDPLDPGARQPQSDRRKGKLQLAALVKALRETPEARVRTRAYSPDGDVVRKTITVRELAETHEAELGLTLQLVGPVADGCARRAVKQIRAAR